jgi:hypothetical protein
MHILDFHRSFLFFEIDFEKKPPKTITDANQNTHNRARIRIDCRCELTNPQGRVTNYYLGEACKTERVGVSRETGIFTQPNADFRPVLSDTYALFFKSWDKNDKGVMLVPPSLGPQPERQVISTEEAFYRSHFHLTQVEGSALDDAAAVVAAADAGHPIVARTAFDQAGYHVVLDYPVVTLNISEKYHAYQTDTGPVLFPELNLPHTNPLETFRLAFCAFNNPRWTEFIIQKPTPIGAGLSVNHYAETIAVDATNLLIVTA